MKKIIITIINTIALATIALLWIACSPTPAGKLLLIHLGNVVVVANTHVLYSKSESFTAILVFTTLTLTMVDITLVFLHDLTLILGVEGAFLATWGAWCLWSSLLVGYVVVSRVGNFVLDMFYAIKRGFADHYEFFLGPLSPEFYDMLRTCRKPDPLWSLKASINPKYFRQTPELCLAFVKENGLALKYVKNQTPEICSEAIKQNCECSKFVKEV